MSEFEQKPTQKSSSRLFWFVLLTLTIFVSAAALMFWLPYRQRHTLAADFENRGGVIRYQSGGPVWLRQYFDPDQLTMFNEIVALDLIKSPATDDDIEMLVQFRQIEMLSLYGPELTDEGFLRLKEFPVLDGLFLVNCPKVSPQAIAEFQRTKPDVEIIRRGNALLGIAGQSVPEGCQVVSVAPGLGAQKAGIQNGDIITEIDGKPVTSYEALIELLMDRQPGETIELHVIKPTIGVMIPGVDLPPGLQTGSLPLTLNATLSSWQ